MFLLFSSLTTAPIHRRLTGDLDDFSIAYFPCPELLKAADTVLQKYHKYF
jgi:hypothetical protein